MDRTDERRRRQPQGHPQRRPSAPGRRQPPGRSPGYDRPPQRREEVRYSQPPRQPRREDPAVRRRPEGYPGQPRRQEPGRAYEQPRQPQARRYQPERRYDDRPRRDYGEPARTRRYEEPARRRPPQGQPRRRTYEEPPRRSAPPSRSNDFAARRERREQERRRRQRQRRRNTVTVLLVVVASILAVFCLYDPEEGKVRLPRPNIEAHTDVPPTDPPTEPPTKPPIVVTPISSLEDLATLQVPSYVSVQIIDVDGDSRRGTKLTAISDIVIHYVGNPGSTAQDNRDWYADLYSEVSSHFVVGLQGEVIQCIPLDEKSSASNHRNGDTISIEICHPDESGKFTDATYESVIELLAWLVKACDLEVENVIRHYEVTGKICPKYYVENDDAWVKLRADVAARVAQ